MGHFKNKLTEEQKEMLRADKAEERMNALRDDALPMESCHECTIPRPVEQIVTTWDGYRFCEECAEDAELARCDNCGIWFYADDETCPDCDVKREDTK